jgi:hypothetical protein
VLRTPQHPYTQRLLEAAPSLVEAVEQWDASAVAALAASQPNGEASDLTRTELSSD